MTRSGSYTCPECGCWFNGGPETDFENNHATGCPLASSTETKQGCAMTKAEKLADFKLNCDSLDIEDAYHNQLAALYETEIDRADAVIAMQSESVSALNLRISAALAKYTDGIAEWVKGALFNEVCEPHRDELFNAINAVTNRADAADGLLKKVEPVIGEHPDLSKCFTCQGTGRGKLPVTHKDDCWFEERDRFLAKEPQ